MRRMASIVAVVALSGTVGHAQITVHDSSVTFRNSITAALKEYLLAVQREQHDQLRQMARRLSVFTDLGKYSLVEIPRWRTHASQDNESFPFSTSYLAALNYGDREGTAYLSLAHTVSDAAAALGRLTSVGRRALAAQLATVDLSDATAIAATHETGQLRYNGRRELAAIDALGLAVTDGSLEQSATAVLDKISGAALIGARQRQARVQLLSALVEQLLVDSKRSRDSEAAAMNMQLVAWRNRGAVNAAFLAGSGDALRTWRQP